MKKKLSRKGIFYPFVKKQTGRIMRLTFLFILLGLMHVSASSYSQNTKLDLDFQGVKVKEVMQAIENQSKFRFAYSSEFIDLDRKINISIHDQGIDEILQTLFAGTNIRYELDDRMIMLYAEEGKSAFQQQRTISGKVTDTSGAPLPGVTVVVKGTTVGTVTDADGQYTLRDISGNGTLIFSFVGMRSQEVDIAARTSINIVLEEDMVGVEEVVVTAFGINREKKQLSYSTQQVAGEQLGATGNNDVMKGMQGKVAGVTVRQVSGAPGSEPKVTIRGSNSISGSNVPLYVVDGFPVDGGISYDIDPNEIKNISVLKGATAAALYGLRASNGVILISTKRGKDNVKNKPTITLSTNYSFDRLSRYPETQKIYGQGMNGQFDAYSAYSWGQKISEMGIYINQLGEEEVARHYDNARDFFKTGGTFNSNINISNKFDKGNYSIGIGYSGQTGIVPTTDLDRVSVKLAGDYDISKKIKVGTSVNYSTYNSNGTSQGGGNSSVFYAAFDTPPSYDLKGKPTHVEGNEYQQINFRGSHDNIYWAVKHNKMESETSSLIGSIDFDYSPANWLNFNYRAGIEEVTVNGTTVYELGAGQTGGRTDPPSGGQIQENMKKRRSINSTFIASVKKELTSQLNFDFMIGHEFYDYKYRTLTATGYDFTIGGFHHLSNASTITADQQENRQRSYAFFGNLNVAYANMLFLTLTGRNDVVSNLPRSNRSFFYPSAGLGFIFTEALKINPGLLSFGKLRMSYAEVGQAGSIYSTTTTYSQGGASNFSFPFNGINAYTLGSSLKSSDLEPENTSTWEFGANLGFLKNRITLDYSYYYSTSDGQIFSVPISYSSGYKTETRNAGKMQNQGHEVILNIKPVVFKNFNWDFTTNFTTYTNKVKELAEGVDMLGLGGNRVSIVAREGEKYPILRGTGYARDPATGKIVVESDRTSSSYGMPLQTTADVDLGKADPDFEANFLNTFKYKNLTLNVQVDWREGGKISSGNSRLAKLYGTHHDTRLREEDYVLENSVKGHYDDNGSLIVEGENDIAIKRGYQYYGKVLDPIRESNVYDASFIRLREVRINYDVPLGFLKRYYIKRASVYIIGRNLWLIKSSLPQYDPEMSDSSGNAIGETYADYPQTSSYGFGINLTF